TVEQNLEDLTIVWLDHNIDHFSDRKVRLCRIINYLKIFDNIEQCIKYIKSIQIEKIFFIVSGTLGKDIIPIVVDESQIVFIYIFSFKKDEHELWSNKYKKIRGVFVDNHSLFDQLTDDARLFAHQLGAINIFNEQNVKETSIQCLTNEQGKFIWFQLIIEVLFRMPQNIKAKSELISECQLQYENNSFEQKKIDEFNKSYCSHDAIRWYTRDCFLYRLLNKAFRTENIDTIFKYRFFISDIYNQLKILHSQYLQTLSSRESILTVYRGQMMSNEELQKLINNVGALISISTFFSTTRSSEVVSTFAGDQLQISGYKSVVIEIDLDQNIDTKPFADISNESYSKNENEVLIAIGTVFRLEFVENLCDTLWYVKLTLTNDLDRHVKEIIKHYKLEIGHTSDIGTLGRFLAHMGEYERADRYYNLALNELLDVDNNCYNPNDLERMLVSCKQALDIEQNAVSSNNFIEICVIYANIATIYHFTENYLLALENYEKLCELFERYQSNQHLLLATLLNNVGQIHRSLTDNKKALIYHGKALELQAAYFPQCRRCDLGLTYLFLGRVYHDMGDRKVAKRFLDSSLKYCLMDLPENHPNISTIYGALAELQGDMGEYSASLQYYEKSLTMIIDFLPPDHPRLGALYTNIGKLRQEQGDYTVALLNYEKALTILLKHLPENHQNIAAIYINMGVAYDRKKDFSEALINYKKALDIKLCFLPSAEHPDLVSLYTNIGVVYNSMHDYAMALKYHRKAHEIELIQPLQNKNLLSKIHNNIGMVYRNMKDYETALKNCIQALEIEMKLNPYNPLACAKSNNNISATYCESGNYSLSFLHCEKALDLAHKSLPPNDPLIAIYENNITFVKGYLSESLGNSRANEDGIESQTHIQND
ncbi:unnamed protein product, partial [Didymodactylos carnosus]